MEFPAYVPAAVRVYIATNLNGDDWAPHGWVQSLESADQQLLEIEGEIGTQIQSGDGACLSGLRREKVSRLAHRDMLAAEVDCLRRLARDDRMRDAYALLTHEFSDDKQWRYFISAARVDYQKYRDQLKRATELKDEIAAATQTLAAQAFAAHRYLTRSTSFLGGGCMIQATTVLTRYGLAWHSAPCHAVLT